MGAQAFALDDYAVQERAAIAHVEGGMPASWAVALAVLIEGPRPEGISESEWRQCVDLACRRSDEFGAELAANGWTFEEVFGVGARWLRLDTRGAGWLVPGGRIVAIDSERIVYERGGDRLTHRRAGAH